MAAKKKTRETVVKKEAPVETVVPKWHQAAGGEEELDPQEEKVLDWILKAVVIFVLGWLALGVLMAVGGLFHLWG